MTREGTLLGHYKKWGRYVDSVVMGLLREDQEASGGGPS
jgi:RimJ/RimL family protein N-acetyltransferase